jgi:Gluconate 2-dehydrogenase subunit 3
MEKKDVSGELKNERQVGRMSRREMVRRFATAVTAGTAVAGVPASAHPVYKHMMNEKTMEQAESEASAHAWKPAFFDSHQNETFALLAERILPGSTEAQVNRFVDLLLSVDTLENQKQFLNSLSAFDAYCLTTYQQPFKNLSEGQQNQVLTVASTAEPGEQLRRHGRRRALGTAPQHSGEESTVTLGDHFENLKHWVSGAYFSSEPGMKYLGWTGQVMWSSFPGCQHSGSHA